MSTDPTNQEGAASAAPITPPTCAECAECGRPWFDETERWRPVLAVDDDDSMEPGEAQLFCPDCAEAEFGAV